MGLVGAEGATVPGRLLSRMPILRSSPAPFGWRRGSRRRGIRAHPLRQQARARSATISRPDRAAVGVFMALRELEQEICEFARKRDWEQFHTPKNLAMALSVEAGELMEHDRSGRCYTGYSPGTVVGSAEIERVLPAGSRHPMGNEPVSGWRVCTTQGCPLI